MSGLTRVSYIEYVKAALFRIAIIRSSFKSTISDRIEISTPINSWKRVLEGVHLSNLGVDPYSGDLFHESPLTLKLMELVIRYAAEYLQYLFVCIDLLTGFLLYNAAVKFVNDLVEHEQYKKQNTKEISDGSSHLLINQEDVKKTPKYVLFAYLYNPYIVLNCVAFTTTGFSNLCLAGVLYALVYRHKFVCIALLSCAILQSFYPVLLIVPVCLVFYNKKRPYLSIIKIFVLFFLSFGAYLYMCFYIAGSWSFLASTYGFMLNVHDLRPNIGLFWYFFTEMFEHFRTLFISALQINATILYLIPLAIHLKSEPVFLFMILTALTAIFKSYPSLGDVGFYLSLLPMWNHLFMFMQQRFIVGCILVITSVLGPTVWHLWIYSGSANANFYFGVTLAFATAQIFLVTDLLFAHKKREFALKNGWPYDASKMSLVLD